MTSAAPSTPSGAAAPAVQADQVRFRYGDRQALDGVSFTVPSGGVHGFLGPNGSGKSTLFRLLATILPPQDGDVRILGHDLRESPSDIRRGLGVVFQHPALDKKLSVLANLRYGGRMYGLGGAELQRRIDEVLDLAQLGERRRDEVGELSGGLRRRVEIAKALLHGPQLLLLDEPSTGLDPAARRALWSFLRERAGVTVLFTTHLMEEAEGADRLTLFDRGKVVVEGSPDELRASIGGDVLLLQSAAPEQLAQDVGANFSVDARPLGDAVRIEIATAHDLIGPLMQRFGERIDRLTLSRPSLEDVFIDHTGRRLDEQPADDGTAVTTEETGR